MSATGETPSPAEVQRPTRGQLFLSFLRLGLTAFGGPAMVAYIGEMAVDRKHWLSRQSFKEGVTVAQSIPGATAMQVAAYVGLRTRGPSGAAAAYVGFGLPAFLLMLLLSVAYAFTHTSPASLSVFRGLQVIVVAIVARAAFSFGQTTVKTWRDVAIALAAGAFLVWGGNPLLAIVLGATAGLLLHGRTVSAESKTDVHEAPSCPSTTRSVVAVLLFALGGLLALLVTDRRVFDLCALMLRIDLFAFGGGFASVPLMLHEVVQVRHWMSTQVFMDGIAMGQVTPGPIVITATFVGYQLAGVVGALCATVAVFLPSFVILLIIVPHFDRVKGSRWFQPAMHGILAAFVGLLLAVTLKFALAVPWTPVAAVFAGAAFAALMRKVGIPWVVVVGAVLSVFAFHPTMGG